MRPPSHFEFETPALGLITPLTFCSTISSEPFLLESYLRVRLGFVPSDFPMSTYPPRRYVRQDQGELAKFRRELQKGFDLIFSSYLLKSFKDFIN